MGARDEAVGGRIMCIRALGMDAVQDFGELLFVITGPIGPLVAASRMPECRWHGWRRVGVVRSKRRGGDKTYTASYTVPNE